jgi:hypothetical protein
MTRRVTNPCLLAALASALALAVALVLAACSSDKKEPEENPNVFPADYKSEILTTMTTMLDDPTNVRNAYISDPMLRAVVKDERYTVCVRSDSRNISRQYSGSKDRIAIFYAGHLNQLIDATKEQCGNAAYKPFPELEHLCQAKKCV